MSRGLSALQQQIVRLAAYVQPKAISYRTLRGSCRGVSTEQVRKAVARLVWRGFAVRIYRKPSDKYACAIRVNAAAIQSAGKSVKV